MALRSALLTASRRARARRDGLARLLGGTARCLGGARDALRGRRGCALGLAQAVLCAARLARRRRLLAARLRSRARLVALARRGGLLAGGLSIGLGGLSHGCVFPSWLSEPLVHQCRTRTTANDTLRGFSSSGRPACGGRPASTRASCRRASACAGARRARGDTA